jgi:type II secretory pathway component PulF
MQRYSYLAIDAKGARVSGEIEASDPDAVVARLTAQGLRVESVRLAADLPAPTSHEGLPASRLSATDLREVGGHISEIVSAGLPLEAGLAAVAEEFPRGRVRRALLAIVRDLETGSDLESALKARRTPPYLPALVRAGQRSGRTGEILENFIAGSQVVSDLRQTLWIGLAYPLGLLLFLIPLGLFLQLKIIPQFTAIFAGFEIRLPAITMILLTVSEFIDSHGWEALGIAAGVVVLVLVVFRLSLGEIGTRRLLCSIPVIGQFLRWIALARFAPVLSLLIEARVPLDEALLLAGDAAGDAEIRDDCGKLAAVVQAGLPLEEAVLEVKRFPASFVRALSWERRHEAFPEVLQSMADMYAGRARAFVALLMAVLPSVLVTLVGFTIGFVVLALFMPLIELLNKLS